MINSLKPIVAYVSLPNYEIAKTIATNLVENRLVACAKIINNLESVYIWEDKLNIDKELYLMLKTSEEKVNEIKDILDKNHPYKVYEFIYFDIKGGNEKYFEWMGQVLREKPTKLDH
jgi:periplasmic divalent cation tolerance protein